MMELQVIQRKIHEVRGARIMLDYELATLYQVETKVLKQAVRRNIKRFPPDFMFELTKDEYSFVRSQTTNIESKDIDSQKVLRSQIVTSNMGGSRYMPFAFTEQGVAMLSSVLRSEIAIEVNISIMRAFVLMREMASGYTQLNRRLEEFMQETNMQFNEIYMALTELAETRTHRAADNPIGFKPNRE